MTRFNHIPFMAHAESLAILRMANSVDVAGKTITIVVDRKMCPPCRHTLPRLLDHLKIAELVVWELGATKPFSILPFVPR